MISNAVGDVRGEVCCPRKETNFRLSRTTFISIYLAEVLLPKDNAALFSPLSRLYLLLE